MIDLLEAVALGHFKDVIQTCNAPLPSVNYVPRYPSNPVIPILVKHKRNSCTPI